MERRIRCAANLRIGSLKLIEIHKSANLHSPVIPERKWKGTEHGLCVLDRRRMLSAFYGFVPIPREHCYFKRQRMNAKAVAMDLNFSAPHTSAPNEYEMADRIKKDL